MESNEVRRLGLASVTGNLSPELIPLRVNDLKQWDYCPRIVFYNTVMPVKPFCASYIGRVGALLVPP